MEDFGHYVEGPRDEYGGAPPWAAALSTRWGLIPSEPSASAERGTSRLSAAHLGGLVFVDPGGKAQNNPPKGSSPPCCKASNLIAKVTMC